MQILLNEAMKLEREAALGAQRYQRTATRRGYANGFKAKTVETRLGRLRLSVPQARGVEFHYCRHWNGGDAQRIAPGWPSRRCTCKACRLAR